MAHNGEDAPLATGSLSGSDEALVLSGRPAGWEEAGIRSNIYDKNSCLLSGSLAPDAKYVFLCV